MAAPDLDPFLTSKASRAGMYLLEPVVAYTSARMDADASGYPPSLGSCADMLLVMKASRGLAHAISGLFAGPRFGIPDSQIRFEAAIATAPDLC